MLVMIAGSVLEGDSSTTELALTARLSCDLARGTIVTAPSRRKDRRCRFKVLRLDSGQDSRRLFLRRRRMDPGICPIVVLLRIISGRDAQLPYGILGRLI